MVTANHRDCGGGCDVLRILFVVEENVGTHTHDEHGLHLHLSNDFLGCQCRVLVGGSGVLPAPAGRREVFI